MLSISQYQCHAVLSLSGEVIYVKCYNVFLETLLFEETYMPAAHLCSPVWLQLSSEASRSRTEKTQELGCGQQAETAGTLTVGMRVGQKGRLRARCQQI